MQQQKKNSGVDPAFLIDPLLFVLILGAVLQDPRELDVIKEGILNRRLAEHLVDVFIGKAVAHRSQQLPQTVLRDESAVFLVEAPEGILDHVLGIRTLQTFTEEGQEHGEIDGTRGLIHHALQVVVRWILAEGRKHVVQVLLLDEAVPVLVDHVEGLLEFGNLGLVEHREDVRRRTLGTFLGRRTTSGCFAGRHVFRFGSAKRNEDTQEKKVNNFHKDSGPRAKFSPSKRIVKLISAAVNNSNAHQMFLARFEVKSRRSKMVKLHRVADDFSRVATKTFPFMGKKELSSIRHRMSTKFALE